MHDIINHAHEMGCDLPLDKTSDPRPWAEDHWVRPVKLKAPQRTRVKPRENTLKNSQTESWEQRTELWKKALTLGIPRPAIQGQPTGIILSLTEAFQKW